MGAVLAGSGRPLVIASGTAILGPGKKATEDDVPAGGPGSHRSASEQVILDLAQQGVRSAAVRLPPSVHGDGDHGFIPIIIGIAREKGVSAYIGDGSNLWPAVHRLDAARVFRLALEKGTPGSRFHAVGDEGIPTRDIAAAIGRGLNLPVQPGATAEDFGWMGRFFALDVPASATLTRERLGWTPTGVGLIEDLEKGTYFQG
jgi:nucleoside-diphosphate-sugar epimerase